MLQRLNGFKKIIAAFLVLPFLSYLKADGVLWVTEDVMYGVLAYIGAQGIADFGKGSKPTSS